MKRLAWQDWQKRLWLVCAVVLGVSPTPLVRGAADLDWAHFVGGSNDDYATAVATDFDGRVVVVGSTFSGGWGQGAVSTSYHGSRDAFAAKYSRLGVQEWSVYVGGASDEQAQGVAVDPAGNVFVVGYTRSPGWAAGGPETNYFGTIYNDSGRQDGFLAKLGPAGQHLWSSYLGGSSNDTALSVALDHQGNIIVVGNTTSKTWIQGGFDTTYGGLQDGFVAKLSPAGVHLWSTFIGGKEADSCQGVAVDSANNIVVVGTTASKGWASGGFNTEYAGGGDGFVIKLSPAGSNLWSSYVGGSGGDSCERVGVDPSDNILVSGSTVSSGWARGGFNTNYNGGRDGFVIKLSPAGTHLWSSYVGGKSEDTCLGLAVDAAGSVFVTGQTFSGGWVSGGFDTTLNLTNTVYPVDSLVGGFETLATGRADAFLAKLSSAGAHLWSSYLGGTNQDGGAGVAVGPGGRVAVCGFSTSNHWFFGGTDLVPKGGVDGYVAGVSEDTSPCQGGLLATPQPLSPGPGSTNRAMAATFTWAPVDHARGYTLRISATNCAAWPFYFSPVLPADVTSFTVPTAAGLADRQACFWSVQALGDGEHSCDSDWSGCVAFTNIFSDTTAPSLSIAATVASDLDITNSLLTIRGTASDNGGVTFVLYQPTNGQWYVAQGTTQWSFQAPLQQGSNFFHIFAEDTAGNRSAVQDKMYFYEVPAVLVLRTNGQGSISRNFSNPLTIGRVYTATAKPASGWLFLGWGGGIQSTNVKLSFLMESNMVLEAWFVTNAFKAAKGTYNGLFYPTNEPVAVTNSGFCTFSLDSKGYVKGKLLQGGLEWPFAGSINASNQALISVVPPLRYQEWLVMGLNFKPEELAVDGWVTNSSVRAILQTDRAITSGGPTGDYTLVVADNGADPEDSPAGFGGGPVKVSSNGKLTVSGTLSEGSAFSQKTSVAPDVQWPFYASLQEGSGVILGWMNLQTNATSQAWWTMEPVGGRPYYTNGFAESRFALVAKYTAPPSGQSPLGWTNGYAVLGAGNLPGIYTNAIQLEASQIRVVSGGVSNLVLSISSKDGQFSGSFQHPVTGMTTPLQGVLSQGSLNEGYGWFLGTNQSGYVRLLRRD